MLYDLLPDAAVTLPLFDETAVRRKASDAVDALNRKYGRRAVSMASVVGVMPTAEDKIAFRKIGEMD